MIRHLAVMVLVALPAHAADRAKSKPEGYRVAGYTCEDIRAGIALAGGYDAAIAYLKARHERLDDKKLAEVRRICKI